MAPGIVQVEKPQATERRPLLEVRQRLVTPKTPGRAAQWRAGRERTSADEAGDACVRAGTGLEGGHEMDDTLRACRCDM